MSLAAASAGRLVPHEPSAPARSPGALAEQAAGDARPVTEADGRVQQAERGRALGGFGVRTDLGAATPLVVQRHLGERSRFRARPRLLVFVLVSVDGARRRGGRAATARSVLGEPHVPVPISPSARRSQRPFAPCVHPPRGRMRPDLGAHCRRAGGAILTSRSHAAGSSISRSCSAAPAHHPRRLERSTFDPGGRRRSGSAPGCSSATTRAVSTEKRTIRATRSTTCRGSSDQRFGSLEHPGRTAHPPRPPRAPSAAGARSHRPRSVDVISPSGLCRILEKGCGRDGHLGTVLGGHHRPRMGPRSCPWTLVHATVWQSIAKEAVPWPRSSAPATFPSRT